MASPYQKSFRFLVWIWGVLIGFLSLLPGKTLPALTVWDWLAPDKIGHFAVYAVWIILYRMAFLDGRHVHRRIAWLMAVIGVLLETLQGLFYRDRFFEFSDIVANCAGILSGWMAFNHLNKQN